MFCWIAVCSCRRNGPTTLSGAKRRAFLRTWCSVPSRSWLWKWLVSVVLLLLFLHLLGLEIVTPRLQHRPGYFQGRQFRQSLAAKHESTESRTVAFAPAVGRIASVSLHPGQEGGEEFAHGQGINRFEGLFSTQMFPKMISGRLKGMSPTLPKYAPPFASV